MATVARKQCLGIIAELNRFEFLAEYWWWWSRCVIIRKTVHDCMVGGSTYSKIFYEFRRPRGRPQITCIKAVPEDVKSRKLTLTEGSTWPGSSHSEGCWHYGLLWCKLEMMVMVVMMMMMMMSQM